MLSLTVIIPTIDENKNLSVLIPQLKKQKGIELEIIVADGGSKDGTYEYLKEQNIQCNISGSGRGLQMNEAFKKCTYENILFLHADSELYISGNNDANAYEVDENFLSTALENFESEINKRSTYKLAGHFSLYFKRELGKNEMSYRYLEEKTHFNRVNTTNGDQGFLLKSLFFKELGGFDDSQKFLEDQKLAEKIRQVGRWITLPKTLVTSARRFETEGFHRRYISMGMIMGLYSIGNKAFFKRAPKIYENQKDTDVLMLTPFFMAVWAMHFKDEGFFKSMRTWFLIGRYIRQNSWQMFYFFDIIFKSIFALEKNNKYPFLKFHDVVFWKITNNLIGDFINTILSFTWFMGVLFPSFLIIEKIFMPLKANFRTASAPKIGSK